MYRKMLPSTQQLIRLRKARQQYYVCQTRCEIGACLVWLLTDVCARSLINTTHVCVNTGCSNLNELCVPLTSKIERAPGHRGTSNEIGTPWLYVRHLMVTCSERLVVLFF